MVNVLITVVRSSNEETFEYFNSSYLNHLNFAKLSNQNFSNLKQSGINVVNLYFRNLKKNKKLLINFCDKYISSLFTINCKLNFIYQCIIFPFKYSIKIQMSHYKFILVFILKDTPILNFYVQRFTYVHRFALCIQILRLTPCLFN